jgi:hypothetical protein
MELWNHRDHLGAWNNLVPVSFAGAPASADGT